MIAEFAYVTFTVDLPDQCVTVGSVGVVVDVSPATAFHPLGYEVELLHPQEEDYAIVSALEGQIRPLNEEEVAQVEAQSKDE